MRVSTTVTSVSWIPSDSLLGPMRSVIDAGVSHWDEPPPERIAGPEEVMALCREDRFRFANVLTCWIEVEDGAIVDAGHDPSARLVMGSTSIRLGPVEATFQASSLPVLQPEPVVEGTTARFLQTVGGRTGAPLPRPVPHPPFVRWQAPLVWTTLALELHADGTHDVALRGASAFPRHWVYDGDGRMRLKSGLTDQVSWLAHSFGDRTPWGRADREVLAVAGETELERLLSTGIMRGSTPPVIRRLAAGDLLARQGDPGTEVLLVLDGVVRVEVEGTGVVGEVGPGAVLGERAVLEGGVRTATLVAVTPVRLAAVPADAVDRERLRALAATHHRE